jgi:hypothetical protein
VGVTGVFIVIPGKIETIPAILRILQIIASAIHRLEYLGILVQGIPF